MLTGRARVLRACSRAQSRRHSVILLRPCALPPWVRRYWSTTHDSDTIEAFEAQCGGRRGSSAQLRRRALLSRALTAVSRSQPAAGAPGDRQIRISSVRPFRFAMARGGWSTPVWLPCLLLLAHGELAGHSQAVGNSTHFRCAGDACVSVPPGTVQPKNEKWYGTKDCELQCRRTGARQLYAPRERERERESERASERARKRDRETERQSARETERERDRAQVDPVAGVP